MREEGSAAGLAGSDNMLLFAFGGLESCVQTRLERHLDRVTLEGGSRVSAAGAEIRTIYFPETVIISCAEQSGVEIGLVGREGFVGWPNLLGARQSPYCATAQLVGGSALAMPADRLREICTAFPEVQGILLRFVQYFNEQMAQTIAASLRDQVEARLARWLLMLHDRMNGDEIALTHQELSDVLSVRRATITDCLHVLEGEHVLQCSRGRLVIRDRALLESKAGGFYGTAEANYRDFLPAFGRPSSEIGAAMVERVDNVTTVAPNAGVATA